jgi:hypothetical protein
MHQPLLWLVEVGILGNYQQPLASKIASSSLSAQDVTMKALLVN